jgi:hypothetical protein
LYTITKIGQVHTVGQGLCLQCEKLVPLDALLAFEVTTPNDLLKGYLHRNCRADWESEHPGFSYVAPRSRL